MGALDHVESMVHGVGNHAANHRRSVGLRISLGGGVSAGESEEAENWEGESGELHVCWLFKGGAWGWSEGRSV
jgi:hypothetical protein